MKALLLLCLAALGIAAPVTSPEAAYEVPIALQKTPDDVHATCGEVGEGTFELVISSRMCNQPMDVLCR